MIDWIQSIFNTREQALIIWIAVLLILLNSSGKMRSSFISLAKAFFNRKIILPLIFCWLYISLIIVIAGQLEAWNESMIKDSILWMFMIIVILVKTIVPKKGGSSIIATLKDLIQPIVVFEFIVNMKTFALGWELVILPIATFVYALVIFSEGKSEYLPVYKLLNGIFSLWGLFILSNSLYIFIRDIYTIDGHQEWLNLILPIWLTVSFVPCLFLIRAYSNYEERKIRKRHRDK